METSERSRCFASHLESSRIFLLVPLVCLGAAGCASRGEAPPPAAAAFSVVALGDSYASGQGAPDTSWTWWNPCTPRWDDQRCNRSRNAPTALAVQLLKNEGHSIAYESLACSGASIDKGVLGPQNGPEPPPGAPPLPAQVDRLQALLSPPPTSPPTPPTRVDAVTLSIGGNDILFEYIVASCVALPDCRLDHPLVDSRLGQLPASLDLLATRLAATGIPANRVFVLEYPDPTQDADGSYCDRKPPDDVLSRLSEAEAEWAARYVLPRLNRALCEAAQRHGWNYVGHIADRFAKHGWCAGGNRWINTVDDSVQKQRHFRGALHPNVVGYSEIGQRLAEALTPLLAGQTPPSASPCPEIPQE
jgi:lysophospholipase L1-like esterase